MDGMKFKLCQRVKIVQSGQSATIVCRMEYDRSYQDDRHLYQVRLDGDSKSSFTPTFRECELTEE